VKWASLGRSSCSSSGSLLALSLFCALCFFALPSPLTAQSTTSAPLPPVQPQSVGWSLSKASLELVTRLTERNDEVRTLLAKLASSEARWQAAENKVTSLSLTVDALQTDLLATSNLLGSSRKELVDYRAAVATVHDLDRAAVKLARDQRDGAALGGLIVGAILVELAHLVGWMP